MAIAWPLGVPCQPEQGTWSEEPDEGAIRFAPDIGPTIDRPSGTVASISAQASIAMSVAQYVVLRDWYFGALKWGTQSFARQHPITGEAMTWKFLAPPQQGAVTGRRVRVAVRWRGWW